MIKCTSCLPMVTVSGSLGVLSWNIAESGFKHNQIQIQILLNTGVSTMVLVLIRKLIQNTYSCRNSVKLTVVRFSSHFHHLILFMISFSACTWRWRAWNVVEVCWHGSNTAFIHFRLWQHIWLRSHTRQKFPFRSPCTLYIESHRDK